MIYWLLFIEFFKTGLFSIGGGPATIPFLKEMSENYGWFTQPELLDMIAVSESTPGALGANMATYVGIKVAGIPGGLIASVALALPSVIVILLIINTLTKYRNSELMVNIFYGIRPATAGLVLGAVAELFLASLFNVAALTDGRGFIGFLRPGALLLFSAVFFTHRRFSKVHPIALIAFGAICGMLFKL